MSLKKKPWNRINLPVYSIVSFDGRQYNMNIATYVTSVSMHPKRMACCMYENTKTRSNVGSNGHLVLQCLAEDQYRLVNLLGKKSGHQVSKTDLLEKRQLLSTWKGIPVLKDALAYMELKVMDWMKGGDHDIFVCDVISWKNNREGYPLTLDTLRAKKLIRI